MIFVFAYGSLLSPDSLRQTVPDARIEDCVPARCTGFKRTFGVAFPNDGSERDKAYFDNRGDRPPFVLFANLTPWEGSANGICIPVSTDDFERIRSRELRYDVLDIGGRVRPYLQSQRLDGSILAFLGKPEYTVLDDAAAGVVSAGYMDAVLSGAEFWEEKCPGFLDDLHASTEMPSETAELRRVDYLDQGDASQDGT